MATASGIYAIQRKESDECYIGSAVSVTGRWAAHRSNLLNGKHHSIRLQNVYNKHGADVLEFAILETVADKARLIEREQVWLDHYLPAYNTAPVAGSPMLGRKHSDETRQKMSVAGKARPPFSAEWRQRISVAGKGRRMSAATRAKMSAAKSGRKCQPFSDEHRAKLSAAGTGRRHSAESRQRMSVALKGRRCGAETLARMSVAQKARAPFSAEHRERLSTASKARWARWAAVQKVSQSVSVCTHPKER